MNDDYLWDRSGSPDPEIVRLESLLRPLGQPESTPTPGAWPAPHTVDASSATNLTGHGLTPEATSRVSALPGVRSEPLRDTASWARWTLAAAAMIALMLGGWSIVYRSGAASWDVTLFDAAPDVVTRRVTGRRDWRVGAWFETGDREKALIKVADIGNVNVEPRTRLRLVHTRAGSHRLELAHGTMHATILAPPGQFMVQAPSATVVDLGCAYTLTVDDEGAGTVTVTLGWVGFESHGRESLIPAGFTAATRPGWGPGTPYYEQTSPSVRAALETIDFYPASANTDAAISAVLVASAERDEATLWHLLARVPRGDRDRVFDRLAQFVPPPPSVTRDGIRDGRRDMLDQWWDRLGLGTMSWWRQWKMANGS